ncbi:heat-inducible transcription repressor HrcA [Mesoplasma syrphidae]|uniref:Heat-inducible transcription repressor HrcA n=1 Tax=Mesoplasma syrphidae TaxID=225999 RepID=A0A2K9C5S3_9MOLU|nr:heat-inducible transcriptional repressor HrcA [Mesoplasma syrphidae]AUF83637.1 heat-inducible transcription repressor HrcA [Mesoplasma syrphidae]
MLTERQSLILKVIIKDYIDKNQPVGSKRILELLGINISSATIRNDSAILEEKGYLEKQHTSSGRIPSTNGYRYYVDYLMERTENEDLKEYLKTIFHSRGIGIDNVLDEASKIISELTKMTAIVSKKENLNDVVLKKIDLVPLSNTMASVIFVLSNGTIQKKVFNLENVSLNDLAISIKLFSDNLIETNIQEIEAMAETIKPILEESVKNYEYVLQTFLKTILQGKDEKKEIFGMKYMLENPEFNDTQKIKNIINLMDKISPFDWYEVTYESNQQKNKISTKIGSEISDDNDDIAILGTEFITKDGTTTSLTLVGPKRVDYSQANQLIEMLIDIINGNGDT